MRVVRGEKKEKNICHEILRIIALVIDRFMRYIESLTKEIYRINKNLYRENTKKKNWLGKNKNIYKLINIINKLYIRIHIVYRKHMIQYPLTLSMEFHNSQFPTRFNNYMTFHRDRIVF